MQHTGVSRRIHHHFSLAIQVVGSLHHRHRVDHQKGDTWLLSSGGGTPAPSPPPDESSQERQPKHMHKDKAKAKKK